MSKRKPINDDPEMYWEHEIMAAQILEALGENNPNPLDWCQEKNCGSFYVDLLTGKPYPCPHRVRP